MPRCSAKAHAPFTSCLVDSEAGPHPEPSPDMMRFWEELPMERRRKLLCVDRKNLFTRIRQQFCSRCFGLFVLRYEEMKGAAALDCPACQEFYAGLAVSDGGEIAVERSVLESEPFTLFAEGRLREREREMRFMTGHICGSGFQKRPGNNMCALHCSPVPMEALVEYFKELPEEHKAALLTLREEDFAAELDAHLKYQLRICRDCRFNVMRVYRDLKQPARGGGGGGSEHPTLELSPDFNLRVAERLVTVSGEGAAEFFNRAEDVEAGKGFDVEDPYDSPDHVRHAETPELAREALVDSAVLIYKSQIEVAFREQTAGHNALLLFVGLALQLMEEQLFNAYKELEAKEAEAELLDLVEREKGNSQPSSKSKKKGKKAGRAPEKEESENAQAKHSTPSTRHCRQCLKLQQGCSCVRARRGAPAHPIPISPLRQRPPGASPAKQIPAAAARQPETEAGQWEVQHSKRRNASQAALRRGGVSSSLGGSSSGSTTPERRRGSLDCPQARPRSPFAKRAVAPSHAAEPAKRSASQRPAAVPVHAYSCTVMVQPPPPPPPRGPKPETRIAAEPSPKKTAWQGGRGLSATVLGPGKAADQAEWTPWSGPAPPLESVATPHEAYAEQTMPAELRDGPLPAILAADGFSLFHFSPVPGPAEALEGSRKDGESSSYQLFGSAQSRYPLVPLGAVLSL